MKVQKIVTIIAAAAMAFIVIFCVTASMIHLNRCCVPAKEITAVAKADFHKNTIPYVGRGTHWKVPDLPPATIRMNEILRSAPNEDGSLYKTSGSSKKQITEKESEPDIGPLEGNTDGKHS